MCSINRHNNIKCCMHYTHTYIYIDGLSDILNKSSIGGSIGGKRINHMLYADGFCIVSLSSAGLQQLLSICDQYCAMHSKSLM